MRHSTECITCGGGTGQIKPCICGVLKQGLDKNEVDTMKILDPSTLPYASKRQEQRKVQMNPFGPAPKKPRLIPRKKLVEQTRKATIDEAIRRVRDKSRNVPDAWKRGYNSAITELEIMKNDN